jgi:hypothetical protein
MTRRKVFALIAVVAIVLILGIMSLGFHQTKQDTLIQYLGNHHVTGNRDDMLKLADMLCRLDAQGVNTTEYLESAFSRESTFAIQNAVFNSGYCEDK